MVEKTCLDVEEEDMDRERGNKRAVDLRRRRLAGIAEIKSKWACSPNMMGLWADKRELGGGGGFGSSLDVQLLIFKEDNNQIVTCFQILTRLVYSEILENKNNKGVIIIYP
jgi:hypothetical protein